MVAGIVVLSAIGDRTPNKTGFGKDMVFGPGIDRILMGNTSK